MLFCLKIFRLRGAKTRRLGQKGKPATTNQQPKPAPSVASESPRLLWLLRDNSLATLSTPMAATPAAYTRGVAAIAGYSPQGGKLPCCSKPSGRGLLGQARPRALHRARP